MFKMKNLLSVLFLAIGVTLAQASQVIETLYEGHTAEACLNAAPKYLKGELRQATTGVIFYDITGEGLIRLLIACEASDKSWSDFGGKFEEKDGTMLTALIRECFEETGGYTLKNTDILGAGSCTLHIDKVGKREVVYVIAPKPADFKFEPNAEKFEQGWLYIDQARDPYAMTDAGTLIPMSQMRSFFVGDFLNSPKFPQIIAFIKARGSHAFLQPLAEHKKAA